MALPPGLPPPDASQSVKLTPALSKSQTKTPGHEPDDLGGLHPEATTPQVEASVHGSTSPVNERATTMVSKIFNQIMGGKTEKRSDLAAAAKKDEAVAMFDKNGGKFSHLEASQLMMRLRENMTGAQDIKLLSSNQRATLVKLATQVQSGQGVTLGKEEFNHLVDGVLKTGEGRSRIVDFARSFYRGMRNLIEGRTSSKELIGKTNEAFKAAQNTLNPNLTQVFQQLGQFARAISILEQNPNSKLELTQQQLGINLSIPQEIKSSLGIPKEDAKGNNDTAAILKTLVAPDGPLDELRLLFQVSAGEAKTANPEQAAFFDGMTKMIEDLQAKAASLINQETVVMPDYPSTSSRSSSEASSLSENFDEAKRTPFSRSASQVSGLTEEDVPPLPAGTARGAPPIPSNATKPNGLTPRDQLPEAAKALLKEPPAIVKGSEMEDLWKEIDQQVATFDAEFEKLSTHLQSLPEGRREPGAPEVKAPKDKTVYDPGRNFSMDADEILRWALGETPEIK